jgi:hypothetical protein
VRFKSTTLAYYRRILCGFFTFVCLINQPIKAAIYCVLESRLDYIKELDEYFKLFVSIFNIFKTERITVLKRRLNSFENSQFIGALVAMVIWRIYLTLYCWCVWKIIFSEQKFLQKIDTPDEIHVALAPLRDVCIDNIDFSRPSGDDDTSETFNDRSSLASFSLCFFQDVFELEYDRDTNTVSEFSSIGKFQSSQSLTEDNQVYISEDANCLADTKSLTNTIVKVDIECCSTTYSLFASSSASKSTTPYSHGRQGTIFPTSRKHPNLQSRDGAHRRVDAFIANVVNVESCTYNLVVCSDLVCSSTNEENEGKYSNNSHRIERVTQPTDEGASTLNKDISISPESQRNLKDRVKDVFYHAYYSYMFHAYPEVRFAYFFACPVLYLNPLCISTRLGRAKTCELCGRTF